MKNYLLNFFAGIFCLSFSHSLFAQTVTETCRNNQTANEINNSATDSSFGFYIKYADKKEPQNPANSSEAENRINIYMVPENLQHERIYIQPNPAKSFTSIKIEATREYKFTIEVTSVAGRLLQQKTGKLNKGINSINLDLHAYPKGIYIVIVTDDKGKRKALKIVKE